jgi:UDP-N-acetylglucosamine 2-epimerase (non-hydrolysing)
MYKIITMIGTRPEIIKMSPVIPLFDDHFEHVLVHSGQHYSANMDSIFFEELALRQPDECLDVGSCSPGAQVARILERFESILLARMPDAVVVQGDTNTTLAGALAVAKHKQKGIRLVHIEAGMRSHNLSQPEEINRRLVDQMSDLLLVPCRCDLPNLQKEGLNHVVAKVTGNTVIESCLRMGRLIRDSEICDTYGLQRNKYVVATFHRQETVDDCKRLRVLCQTIKEIGREYDVILPLHPRTQKMIQHYGVTFTAEKLRIIDPVGYQDMIALLKNARFCMTDSGGIVEEAAVLGVPGLILRSETEHMKYVTSGIHRLVAGDFKLILEQARTLMFDEEEYLQRKAAVVPKPKSPANRIVKEIYNLLQNTH